MDRAGRRLDDQPSAIALRGMKHTSAIVWQTIGRFSAHDFIDRVLIDTIHL